MKTKVCVIDMQPIDPPVGGGRLRLLGLYHALGPAFDVIYVGSYDWPGENYREVRHSENLLEITVPLSEAHFRSNSEMQRQVIGKTIIDASFSKLVPLSDAYLQKVAEQINDASVVIFSHPWAYPAASQFLREDQFVVYDSQNCEGIVKAQILDVNETGAALVREVVEAEYALLRRSDLVLACSPDDLAAFNSIYEIAKSKIVVVPNGVFATRIEVPHHGARHRLRQSLEVGFNDVAIFIGSAYEPNVEAAHYLCKLSQSFPEVLFVLCGGVGDAVPYDVRGSNLLVTGQVSDEVRNDWLRAANLALNPMTTGSGTNIKMFDFMAAGLAIISTPTGHRGIAERAGLPAYLSAKIDEFPAVLRLLLDNPEQQRTLAINARKLVEDVYAWESISPRLGEMLQASVSESVAGQEGAYRLCMMSSWGRRCGISEYSNYMLRGLCESKTNYEISLVVSEGYSDDALPFERSEIDFSYKGWNFDNLNWSHGHIDVPGILEFIGARRAESFLLQYHPGFFSEENLVELVNGVAALGTKVLVVLHNSRALKLETIVDRMDSSVVLFVHSEEERAALSAKVRSPVKRLPHGTFIAAPGTVGRMNTPVRIATFGFLRPHKGVLELISMLPLIEEAVGPVELHAYTALYPSADSRDYLHACVTRIKELELQSSAFVHSEYLPPEDVVERLASCDLVVFPYAESDEGSSAAARMGLAAGRPVIVTPSSIFADISGIACRTKGFTAADVVNTIVAVLSNPLEREEFTRRAEAFCLENSWLHVARILHDEFVSLESVSTSNADQREAA